MKRVVLRFEKSANVEDCCTTNNFFEHAVITFYYKLHFLYILMFIAGFFAFPVNSVIWSSVQVFRQIVRAERLYCTLFRP